MIESNILGAAVGIQNQGVIDKTEGTNLPSTGDAVIAGKFKRGRMDKAFVVTRDNYKAMLGHDPSNPSYQTVEDAFKRGLSEVSVFRIGSSTGDTLPPDGGGGGGGFDWATLTPNNLVEINANSDNDAFFEMEINGAVYNIGGMSNLVNKTHGLKVIFEANAPSVLTIKPFDNTMMHVKLTPKGAIQKEQSTRFITGSGTHSLNDGVFHFRLKHDTGFGS